MTFKTLLSDVGKGFERFFSEAVVIAGDAEPLVAVIFPGASALYNAVVSEVAKIEAIAIAAGKQAGSGTQKLAAVVAAVTPQVLAFAEKNGSPVLTADHIASYVNAVVATINSLPAKV